MNDFWIEMTTQSELILFYLIRIVFTATVVVRQDHHEIGLKFLEFRFGNVVNKSLVQSSNIRLQNLAKVIIYNLSTLCDVIM